MATAPRSETLSLQGGGDEEGEEEGKERPINWALGWLAHLWAAAAEEEEEEEEEGTNAVGRNLIWSTVDFLSP